ncbi:MAG: hypothetical protein IJD13_03140 [Oscillospiraceae bacterium]|nr:hypothetical protein [Oscillospiraceae bacterium]
MIPAILSVLTTALCAIFPSAFVHGIGSLIRLAGKTFGLKSTDIKQFSEIFDQLKEASVLPPVWLLLLVFAACFAAAVWARKGKKGRRIAVAVIWLLLLLPLMLLSLWFSNVNDLQYGIVISALICMVMAGVF